MRPPKLAIRMAAGGIAVAATLALGVAGASAAPNPGSGNPGATIVTGVTNPAPNTLSTTPYAVKEDGPQTANVPTLAWVGEEVRLVACDDSINISAVDGLQEADWNVEDWTGDQAFASTPTFDGSEASNLNIYNTGSAAFFKPSDPLSADKKGCVSADIKSLHAGLSIIKLDVAQDGSGIVGGPSNTAQGSGDPVDVYSEQFIVIWMTANAPTLTEASVSSLDHPGSPGTDAPPTLFDQLTSVGMANAGGSATVTPFLGDPTGNSQFIPDGWGGDVPWDGSKWDGNANKTPTTNNGLVDIRVTGSFPIEDQPPATTNVSYFGATSFTLPRDWAKLAGILATSAINPTGTQPNLWDIHGGPTNTLTHVGTGPYPIAGVCNHDGTVFGSPFDAVDDCASTGGTSPVGNPNAFSRVFGDFTTGTTATIGPYDDEAPNETLLSDGRLNSDDAPMPALPITVSIAGNKGGTDIGGVGGLYGVAKTLIYSHDFDGSASPTSGGPVALTTTGQGNLYNPYYSEFIPSTTRPISEASGVTGVYDAPGFPGTSGDDFPGFSLGYTSPYTFWTALDASTVDTGGATKCLHQAYYDGQRTPSLYYNNPDYPTSITVYTDERGEAYVDYNPGNGFYWNNLIAAGKLSVDNNGGCDLQSLLNQPIGTSTISAQTEYPYQAVPYNAPAGANTITKTVTSLWNKTLTAYPKLDVSGVPASIFVATATDINGEPFADETVCFSQTDPSSPSGNIFSSQVLSSTGAVLADTTGSDATNAPDGTSGYTCAKTNKLGEAGIEYIGSDTAVDVVAWFVNEHLLRDLSTTLGSSSSSGTPPGVVPSLPVITSSVSDTTGGSAGSTPVITTPVISAGAVTPQAPKVVAIAAHVTFARLVHSKKGTFLKLNVASSNATATITIKVRGKNHKVRTLHVKVKTNTAVSVNLGSGKVLSYSVSVH